MGAAWIADRAVLPAIRASANGRLVGIASRDGSRAAELAARHGVERVLPSYASLLDDPEVDAVYIPLVNSLHMPWTQRALAAGKHVLCEKPLGLDAGEARHMAAAAAGSDRLLMEALMYRFHPRMVRLRDESEPLRHLHAAFAFALDAPGNYRLRPDLGGGALLDVGSYTVSAARWFLGEPDRVQAVAEVAEVDMSVAAAMAFPGGATATIWAGFRGPEHQELVLARASGVRRVQAPFTAWRDPADPYQLMVEAFAAAALGGRQAPIPLADSIANLEVIDRIRLAAGLPRP